MAVHGDAKEEGGAPRRRGGESDIVATPDGRIHPLGSTYRVRGDLQGVERPSIGGALCGAAAPRGSWSALNRPLTHPPPPQGGLPSSVCGSVTAGTGTALCPTRPHPPCNGLACADELGLSAPPRETPPAMEQRCSFNPASSACPRAATELNWAGMTAPRRGSIPHHPPPHYTAAIRPKRCRRPVMAAAPPPHQLRVHTSMTCQSNAA